MITRPSIKWLAVALSFVLTSAAIAQPVQDASLKLWLDASDVATINLNGSTVASWLDKSDNNNHATQTNSAWQPTYVPDAGGGVSGVRFDPIDDRMITPLNVSTGDYTIFATFNYASSVSGFRRAVQGSNNWLIGPYANGLRHFANGWVTQPGPPVTQNQFYNTSVLRDDNTALPGASRFIVDGTDITGNPTFNGYPGIIGLGAQGAFAEPLGGVLTEVLVYDRLLDTAETDQVNQYLNAKRDTLNANIPVVVPATGTTTVGNYSGGDVGEGLDLDGTFQHAVNVGGEQTTVRDVTFAENIGAPPPGVFISTNRHNNNWYPNVNYGDSPNDNALEVAAADIRWTQNGTAGLAILDLIPGTEYKLQLLFDELCCDRGVDIAVDGIQIVDDLNLGPAGDPLGWVVTFEFNAPNTEINIGINAQNTPFPDPNAILNAFTLEVIRAIPEPTSAAFFLLTLAPAALRRRSH